MATTRRSEALDNAEAALAEWDTANARLVRTWYANHHHLADALRALVTEHRRLLAELDEAHAHFQVQEARIREARQVDDAMADRAQNAMHEFMIGPEQPLTHRQLGIARQAWKYALCAALTPDGQEKNR